MAYFAPYIDGSGLHMPTYEDRLSALAENYRAIFGLDSELSESVLDYQLLSVFARSLDDASTLVLSAFHQMNRTGFGSAAPAVWHLPVAGGNRRFCAVPDHHCPGRERADHGAEYPGGSHEGTVHQAGDHVCK